MEHELIECLRKDIASPVVVSAIQKYNLNEKQKDPPDRCYYISRKRGVSLLSEDEQIVDVQIYVEANKRFSAFDGKIPFGILKDMSQIQVHQLLGPPATSDAYDSKYEFAEIGAALTVSYNDLSMVKYLSIGLPMV